MRITKKLGSSYSFFDTGISYFITLNIVVTLNSDNSGENIL